MKTRVSSEGQIVLPAEFRQENGIEARADVGVVAWLLACPDKGYFVPIESESTESL